MNDKLISFITKKLDEKGWSQRELGRRAGLSVTTISDVMRGERKPSHGFCVVVAKALGEEPDEIFKLAGLIIPGVSKGDELPQSEMIKEIYRAAKQGALLQLAESGQIEYLKTLEGNPSFKELFDLAKQLSSEELKGLLQVAHLLVDHKQKNNYDDHDNPAVETT